MILEQKWSFMTQQGKELLKKSTPPPFNGLCGPVIGPLLSDLEVSPDPGVSHFALCVLFLFAFLPLFSFLCFLLCG